MINARDIDQGVLYYARVKRSGKLAVVSRYEDRLCGTDPNCFVRLPDDYEIIEPVIAPASVHDYLTTRRIEELEAGNG